MTRREGAALVRALSNPPYVQLGLWKFSRTHPDFLAYHHPAGTTVYFMPDYEERGTLVIKVVGKRAPRGYQVEFTSMQADDLVELLKPFLETGPGRKAWDPRKAKK